MGRLEDRNFKYIPKSESEKPGYLERRMKIYKEMVKNESVRNVHHGAQKGDGGAGDAPLPRQQVNGFESRKFAVVSGKGS